MLETKNNKDAEREKSTGRGDRAKERVSDLKNVTREASKTEVKTSLERRLRSVKVDVVGTGRREEGGWGQTLPVSWWSRRLTTLGQSHTKHSTGNTSLHITPGFRKI